MVGDPFDLVGDEGGVGVVCVHGFTGTPYEMRFLGDRLHEAGFSVCGIRLPGHGTSVEDLDRTTAGDWADAVDRAVTTMRARCRTVALVGQSLGGLLALHTAAHRPEVACVASLAAPLWLGKLATRVARWTVGSRIRVLPKLGGSDVRDRHARRENPSYRGVPTRALGELTAFMRVVDDELPRVGQPVLVLHASHDHTAPVACATRLAERTHAVRTRILPRSYHLIAIDVERDAVASEVRSFLTRHTRGESCVT